MVPKDPGGNAAWREWIWEVGSDPQQRQAIFDACARDLLFFVDGFLWIKQESPVVEDRLFITWPKQEEYVALLTTTRRKVEADKTGRVFGNVVSVKPREVGWSWLDEAESLHFARFTPGATVMVGSRVEYDVDKPGASKTLFWKLDYFIEHLPRWFMPEGYWNTRLGWPTPAKAHRTSLRLSVPGFGTIIGSATHKNFGRSGRYAKMDLDEFAHVDRGQLGMGDKIWAGTTNTCRLRRAYSTPDGPSNKFAALIKEGSVQDVVQIFTVHWYDDPAKMVGAYRLTEPMEVGPVTLEAGDWWSPWAEATRAVFGNDPLFAQEVLLSFEGTGGGFYAQMLPRIKHEQVREPVFIGNVKHDESLKGPRVTAMVREAPGFFKSWEPIPENFVWPKGLHCMGIDVASGSKNREGRGASNSVIVVGRMEGERVVKVCQYRTHGVFPHVFARMVHAIGWCFRSASGMPAEAIWEPEGPGTSMGGVLMGEFNYPNVFWNTSIATPEPGLRMQVHRRGDGTLAGSKVNVFNDHKAWLDLGNYSEPSYDTYLEMEQYRYNQDAGAEHWKRKGSLDPSEGHSNHGDSVIATVLMLWCARKLRERGGERQQAAEPPVHSVAWAQKRVKREAARPW